jgi:hypothetical protein
MVSSKQLCIYLYIVHVSGLDYIYKFKQLQYINSNIIMSTSRHINGLDKIIRKVNVNLEKDQKLKSNTGQN